MPINTSLHLAENIFDRKALKGGATRQGFGKAMRDAGEKDERIVGLSADLTESTQMSVFAEAFPERFVQVGVAEQNLVTVASGMAAEGKIPFASSFGAFSPGRNWEQIRTTICYNEQNVKLIATHTGLNAGPDGATHQILEDVALMRVLPNMVVIVPADMQQAYAATLAIAADPRPTYLRLAREKLPIFTTPETPFEIGKAQVLMEGTDVTLITSGPVTYEGLYAAHVLEGKLSVEVINVHTIKPFDVETVVASARKTGRVVTLEEHQVSGGLAGIVAETLSEQCPTPLVRIGMHDRFGESGSAAELWNHFGFTSEHIAEVLLQSAKK
jgi:transketolase